MASATQVVPQPLSGEEIRKGIASRISSEVPEEHAEAVKEIVYLGLAATCSLESSTAYSKFKASWKLAFSAPRVPAIDGMNNGLAVCWWVDYELDDFGRITKGGIGGNTSNSKFRICNQLAVMELPHIEGEIPEVPPDRFRRETSQPIPKPRELKQPDPQQSSLSRAVRGQGKRRDV
jgi:hypothetical protein